MTFGDVGATDTQLEAELCEADKFINRLKKFISRLKSDRYALKTELKACAALIGSLTKELAEAQATINKLVEFIAESGGFHHMPDELKNSYTGYKPLHWGAKPISKHPPRGCAIRK